MKKIEFLPGLTPLRGIAALLVIFFHYNLFITELVAPETSPITGQLYLMVDLFFVLSGFIMCHVYGETFTMASHETRRRRFSVHGSHESIHYIL